MPNIELSELMGRSKQSIQHMASRMSLTTKLVANKKFCIDCGIELSRAAIYADRVKRCFKCSMVNHSNSNHHNWKGGVSSLKSLVHVYLTKAWSKKILMRDNFICQMCKKRGGDLEVHHNGVRYHKIRDAVLSMYPELDLKCFDNRVFLAKKIVEAHKSVPGITLCVRCHSKLHNRKTSELLETPKSCDYHNIISNDKCDGLKNISDWTISSQASTEVEEGSTTNAYDPERIMKRHERPLQ